MGLTVMGNITVGGKIIEGDSVNGGNGDSSLADSIRANVQAQIAAARAAARAAAAAAAAQNGDATVVDGDFVAGGGVHHGNLNVNGDFVSRRKITIIRK